MANWAKVGGTTSLETLKSAAIELIVARGPVGGSPAQADRLSGQDMDLDMDGCLVVFVAPPLKVLLDDDILVEVCQEVLHGCNSFGWRHLRRPEQVQLDSRTTSLGLSQAGDVAEL